MKPRWFVAALVLGAACAKEAPPPAAQQAAAAQPTGPIVVSDSTIKTPESILYDPIGDVYLVSNINGSPVAKDNNGFISRVSPDGKILAAKWIAGGVANVKLDAPKGTGLRGDTLFVADITVVRLFNRNTGAPLGDWAVPGSTFLNDIAVGPDGTIYITDSGLSVDAKGNFGTTGTDAVYKFDAKGKAVALAKGATLGAPNGVLGDSTGVIVVTNNSGVVFRLDGKTGKRTDLPQPPKAGLDGIVRLGDGSLLISSWGGSAVYRLAAGGTAYTTAVDSATSPADIGYDTKRGRVLIPNFTQNKLVFRELK